jgi:hypothetical protein
MRQFPAFLHLRAIKQQVTRNTGVGPPAPTGA